MPKRNFIPVQLAPEQYDKCVDCPLIGLIPENERKEGKRKKYVCLGTMKALTSKGVWIKASKRDAYNMENRDYTGAPFLIYCEHGTRGYSKRVRQFVTYKDCSACQSYKQGKRKETIL